MIDRRAPRGMRLRGLLVKVAESAWLRVSNVESLKSRRIEPGDHWLVLEDLGNSELVSIAHPNPASARDPHVVVVNRDDLEIDPTDDDTRSRIARWRAARAPA